MSQLRQQESLIEQKGSRVESLLLAEAAIQRILVMGQQLGLCGQSPSPEFV
jgi:hypothetical protein